MEKPIFDFSGFLHELDSTEELVEFNVWDYTDKYVIDDNTAQYLTYESISFYTIDYLCQILENEVDLWQILGFREIRLISFRNISLRFRRSSGRIS